MAPSPAFAVAALGGHLLALLAKDLNGCFEIAVGLCEGLLAIHHARAGLLAELVDFCCCDAHVLKNDK